MSTQNLMRIKEGRAIFMAVRENLLMRMIARELLASWYQEIPLDFALLFNGELKVEQLVVSGSALG